MVGRTKAPTAAQRRRMDRLVEIGCVCCRMDNQRQPNRTEIHHLVDKGTRALSGGHDATVPLCVWHHRGVPARCMTPAQMARAFGPSKALTGRAFKEHYGTDRVLLFVTDKQLGEQAA